MAESTAVAVIDDDESVRTALTELIESLGYDARGYASADAFVAGGEIGHYDCIVTDIHMPGLSGFELKDLLVTRGFKVPVIMITARIEPDLAQRVHASGVICLLTKPFQADAMIACLDRALNS